MSNVPILMAQLNGSHEYAPDGHWLKLLRHTVAEIETHEGGFADIKQPECERDFLTQFRRKHHSRHRDGDV